MWGQPFELFLLKNKSGIKTKKMLVVEDDDLSIKAIRRIFQNDFEMEFCKSVDEYYEKHSKTKYDIIMMDISLRGTKNGLELIKEIKTVPAFTDTPILCLTAHEQTKMRQTAIESSSNLYITKPVSNKILKEAVASLIK